MGNTRGIIPEVINNYNVYKEGNALIGVSGEVSLAEFQSVTDTISGPGLLGEIETVVIGMFQSMKQEIPFRILDDDVFTMANPRTVQELTLRAAEQVTDKGSGGIVFKGMRVVFRGRPSSFKPGTIKQGAQMGASVTLELTYVLIEIDGEVKLELDKLNSIYKIAGKDIMGEVSKLC